MENLKIRLNNEAEIKESQELFFKLGAKKILPDSVCYSSDVKAVCLIDDCVFVSTIPFESCCDSLKEITLSELKGLVASKLIAKPFKEYLVFNGDGVFYATNQDKGIVGTCYEIPAGAEFATGVDRPMFRKDGYYGDEESLINDNPYWRETKITLANAKARDINILWVRGSQPEQSLNDIVKTAEDHRQSFKVRPEDAPIELTSFGYFPDPDLSTALNGLCNEFGCPPGAHRMAWLRQQLVTAKLVTESQAAPKDPVTIDRETARHRLAMLLRGENTTINGREVVFGKSGYFDVVMDSRGGHYSKSLKSTLDYLFK